MDGSGAKISLEGAEARSRTLLEVPQLMLLSL